MTRELLSTPESLRLFLEIPPGLLDIDRATSLIEGVSGLVLGWCNRDHFVAPAGSGTGGSGGGEPVTVDVDGTGSHVLILRGAPILDVVSIIEDPRGKATELVDDLDFEWSAHGVVTRRRRGVAESSDPSWFPGRARSPRPVWCRRPRFYAVTYGFGFPEVPAAVELVVNRICARAVTNPEGLITERDGGYVSGFGGDDSRLPTLSAPDRIDLAPFRL